MNVTVRDARTGDEPSVKLIVRNALVEYGLSPDRGHVDADIEDLVGNFIAPGGAFRVLVNDADEIVGCGGLYVIDAQTAEIRKMYFTPALRGKGFGRALLQDLLERARRMGCSRVVLQTASPLTEAQALYTSAGFIEVAPTHKVTSCDKGFELSLSGDRAR